MPRFKTPLEIYALLPRTNCGDCGTATCLAFAAAVLKDEKNPRNCPHLDTGSVLLKEGNVERQVNMERIREEQLAELRAMVTRADILSRTDLLGGRREADRLVITCLGKDFAVGPDGSISSQCHTHAWFALPLFDYILRSTGADPTGRWIPFRELPHGKTWAPLFARRCEQPLQQIADRYRELFGDLVSMFSGFSSRRLLDSDIAVVLRPFPKVPVLVCYWMPEEGMGSKLHIFFDETAEQNLSVESLFALGAGIARMLERIMYTHTDDTSVME